MFGEPPCANYDDDDDENENAVDDDVLTRHGASSSRHESRVGLDEATVNNPSTGLSIIPRSHHRLSLPPRPFSHPAGLATRPHLSRQSRLRGLSPPAQIRQSSRPPSVLLNFQTDLSSYSEILPPLLACGAVALLALLQEILFRYSSVHSSIRAWASIGRYLEGTGVPRDRMVRLDRGVDTIIIHPLLSGRCLPPPAGAERGNHPGLVCVCRLGLEKGVDFSAREAVQLVAAALSFKLLIIGGNRNPAAEDDLRRLFEPVEDRVVLTGFLTSEPLTRAYAVGDLFLHCFITETFGLVVLEAMASGVPVIAPNRGGPSDIFCHEKMGYLRILQVSSDPDLRAWLSTAARQFAEDTTWEKINRCVAGQLADALKERQRQRQRQPQRKLLHTTAGTDSLLPSRSSLPPVNG
ncbi:hypothetical protein V8E54_000743 [Elaphomyces granulatus]